MTSARTQSTRRLWIDGQALWSSTAADKRPAPELLPANERRRAPDAVLLALDVASRALAASGHDAADVATVFASAHGDLAITNALCKTLAAGPALLSPTRFHHSVHNAASGYWAIASGSRAASTALAAFETSFAAGLLEAATQCQADAQAVMLVAYDTEATGALLSVNRSRGLLAMALVLSPRPGPRSAWAMDWSLRPGAVAAQQAPSAAAQGVNENASAPGLPLFEALARGQADTLAWPLSQGLALNIALYPILRAPMPTPPAA